MQVASDGVVYRPNPPGKRWSFWTRKSFQQPGGGAQF
jgi:phage pi2 protein 07